MNQTKPQAALPATPICWHFVARNVAGQVVEGWICASPELEIATSQVRRAYPDLATISLMSRSLPGDHIAGDPPLCEYCHTRHYGHQDHYLA